MRTRSLAILAVAAASLTPVGASAQYDCSVAAGSASNPHLSDPANDYHSAIDGRGPAVNGAMADVHGSGIDLLDTWVSTTPGGPLGTTYRVNIQVGNLTELANGRLAQAGTRFQFHWLSDVGDPARKNRYVEAAISHGGVISYSHGYLTVDPNTGIGQQNNGGSTTGSVTTGSPGVISMVLPFHNPSVGLPSIIDLPFTRSNFDTAAFVWYTDEGKDQGPCFQITL